ncbi:hypothetical protein QQP08_021934 [Theobroma cacao]|nr:hypothetical protein QQP08_021934 [Theobroma cacao]
MMPFVIKGAINEPFRVELAGVFPALRISSYCPNVHIDAGFGFLISSCAFFITLGFLASSTIAHPTTAAPVSTPAKNIFWEQVVIYNLLVEKIQIVENPFKPSMHSCNPIYDPTNTRKEVRCRETPHNAKSFLNQSFKFVNIESPVSKTIAKSNPANYFHIKRHGFMRKINRISRRG